MEELIRGSFKKYAHFGFFIPENRGQYGGDFFVNTKNDLGALDGQRVKARPMKNTKGKKPEAKIIELLSKDKIQNPQAQTKRTIQGIYTQTNDEFGFIEVSGDEKGFFVHSSKKGKAQNGDKVDAEISLFNGRKEAKVLSIVGEENDIITGEYVDKGSFGFVYTKKGKEDIFISPSNANNAQSGDQVELRIIKTGGRRPEGIIITKK